MHMKLACGLYMASRLTAKAALEILLAIEVSPTSLQCCRSRGCSGTITALGSMRKLHTASTVSERRGPGQHLPALSIRAGTPTSAAPPAGSAMRHLCAAKLPSRCVRP